MKKNIFLGSPLGEKWHGFLGLLSCFALEMKLHVLSLIPERTNHIPHTLCFQLFFHVSESVRSKLQMPCVGLFLTVGT